MDACEHHWRFMALRPASTSHDLGRSAAISPSNTASHKSKALLLWGMWELWQNHRETQQLCSHQPLNKAAAPALPHTANKAPRAPEHGAPSPGWAAQVSQLPPHTQPSPHYLLNESQERFPVVLPLLWKLRSRWVFAAGQLQCDLKAVGPHVVVILHPT